MSRGELGDRNTIRALEENFCSMWAQFGNGQNCTIHRTDGAVWLDTPIPNIPYNGVLSFAADETADTAIDRIFAHYAERHVPFFWFLHPSARPTDLGSRLRARGFDVAETVQGMAMDLALLPPMLEPSDGVTIEQVLGDDATNGFLDFVAWRWAVKEDHRKQLGSIASAIGLGTRHAPTRAFVVHERGELAAKATIHVRGNVAGLYGVTTKPEFRGKGHGRLVSLCALRAAREAGARFAILHSSPMAVSLYESLGFAAIAPFHVFTLPNTFHI